MKVYEYKLYNGKFKKYDEHKILKLELSPIRYFFYYSKGIHFFIKNYDFYGLICLEDRSTCTYVYSVFPLSENQLNKIFKRILAVHKTNFPEWFVKQN